MIAKLSKALGKLALLAATAAFLTAVSLFLAASFLMTWPILRKSPRDARIRATADLAAAAVTAIAAFKPPEQLDK